MGEVTNETSIIQRLGGRTSNEISTMDPNHDRQVALQRRAQVHIQWYKDVEVETILTDLFGDIRGCRSFNFSLFVVTFILFCFFLLNLILLAVCDMDTWIHGYMDTRIHGYELGGNCQPGER